jgi:transposase
MCKASFSPNNNLVISKKGYTMTISIGIDISKDKFDVCIYESYRHHSLKCFTNSPAGFKAFSRTLRSIVTHEHPCVIGLEATGVYGDKLCHFLHALGELVYVINPLQIKYYAKSQMSRSKTDAIDAQLIAQFMYHHKDSLHPWQPRLSLAQ